MDIELKWEKYKNEKMQNDTIKKLNYILPSLVVIFFIFFMIAVELDKYTMAVNSAFLCMFNLVALVLRISYLENSNKNKKETFFRENKDQIYNLQIDETLELTDVLQEHEKKFFLIITSEIRGRRKQTFHFSTKSKNGNETRVYEKENESEFFYRQINKFDDEKPRLEVKAYKFASKLLENEFNTFISSHLRYCYQYTFFVPEGSVKKLFV